jgi:hypothetical protein
MYTLGNFPFQDVITKWKDMKAWYCLDAQWQMVCLLRQLKFLFWVPFLLGNFHCTKFCTLKNCKYTFILWFCWNTHVKWLHRLVFSFETYFERSCRSVKQAWRFLFGVSEVILCNVNAGEFGLWSLDFRVALCSMHLCFWTYCLQFVFCFILARVASWRVGLCLDGGTLLLQMGKVFWDWSSTLLRVHEIVVCLLSNAFSPWLIQIVKLCYVHLVWLPKAHSWFSTIVSHTTQFFYKK